MDVQGFQWHNTAYLHSDWIQSDISMKYKQEIKHIKHSL